MKKITYRRKEKEKKDRGDKGERKFSTKLMLYSFVVTVVLYLALVFTEKSLINAEEKIKVYVVAADIPKDVEITDENVSFYFKQEDRVASTLPQGYVTDSLQLVGMVSDRAFIKNETAVEGAFSLVSDRIRDIVRPVEVSLNANSLAQVVGGVLRAGDYINIWSVKTMTVNGAQETVSEVICTHAYVTRAFTSTGTEVGRDSNEANDSTTVINIIIPESQEEAFNTAIVEGTIRVGRCMYSLKMDMDAK